MKPEYNYVRQVDYCSGAALLLRRNTFLSIGGFDQAYAPAYYEDSDLCFRLREAGLKTYYQPASCIFHHEGVSHGVDTAVGIKSYQVVNRRRFVQRWAPTLAARHYPRGQAVFRARDTAMHRKLVLVIDHYVPTPDRDAGSRTVVAFLRVLVQAGLCVKFRPHNGAYAQDYTEALQAMGVEVLYGSAPFDTWIREHGHELDHVLLSRPNVAEDLLPLLRQHSVARIVYYGHDLHFRRMRLQADVLGDLTRRRAADAMEKRERAIWRQCDLSLYPSAEEVAVARSLEPDAGLAPIVPYAFERFGEERSPPPGHLIIFVGGFGHPPNEDAAVWFTAEVMPLIRKRMPDVEFAIIGSNPTLNVRSLAEQGVAIHADLTDMELAAFYGRARLAVIPLRYGAGVKLKVVEALREGIPLVTTGVGAQGLPGLEGLTTVTDDPAAFADAALRILNDDGLWMDICKAELSYARSRFATDVMTQTLLELLNVQALAA